MKKQILCDSENFSPEVAGKLEELATEILKGSKTKGQVEGRRLLVAMNSQLWERESLVLTKRYALKGGKPMTLEETSIELGVSEERISEIEANALKKLRRNQILQF